MEIEWVIEVVEEVDSTNRLAMEAIFRQWDRGAGVEGIAFRAQRQSAGKGQHGRKWESPPGGLYLSAVVENVPEEARDKLALVAGLAVARAIRAGGVEAMIRWPNDLVIGGKKVAGILCEAAARGNRWAAAMGIGVNVTTDVETLPAELRGTATALALHVKKGAPDGNPGLLDMKSLADEILDQISQQLAVLRHEGLTAVIQKIQPLDALQGKRVRFSSGGETFEAAARGVSPEGHLLLSREGGLPEPFAAGTVLAVLD